MSNNEFSPWPSYTMEEAEAVKNVLLSNRVNYWTGPLCREFESEFAAYCGTQYAIALANGTVALEIALSALGVQQGDEVIVTPRTFIASASSIVTIGATPVFVDVDMDSGNIPEKSIEMAITPRTKAIICVHLAGWPCEMDSIMDLSTKYNLWVIEDCAQAHGASYKGAKVGSIGHIGTWSFCQDKIMTTGGEGGMVTTGDHDLWSKMWSLKDHGKSYTSVYSRHHPPGFRWLHESFGSNFRMTEMQAAIGRIQLKRMSDWHRSRIDNACRIWEAAKALPGLRVPQPAAHIEHAAYRCYVYVNPVALRAGWSRDRIINDITNRGVPCFSGSCSEVYLEKAFVNAGIQPAAPLTNAKELGETSLAFLVHPTLTEDEIDKTCRVLADVMHTACIQNH
ncbi:MAG: DegT/DnrJ/EryC1/StrS aminotransferase family protein [Candidatus Thiodiazotropha sp.]